MRLHYTFITIVLVLMMIPASGFALANDENNEPAETKQTFADKISIGAKTGFNFTTMHYSDPFVDGYKSRLFPRLLLGAYIDFAATEKISIRPEMTFIGKGISIRDETIDYKF